MDIPNHYVTMFSASVKQAVQQKISRLGAYVETKLITGEDFAYDGLGTIEAVKREGRYQAVKFQDIEHLRRKLSTDTFDVTLPIDEKDVFRILQDPKSMYVEAAANAIIRRKDKIIYDALFASVQTGKSFGTTLTAAQDGVITVNATGAMVYEHISAIIENFIDNEVGNDGSLSIVLGIGGEENTALCSEIEFSSEDYARQFERKDGRLVAVEGIKIIQFGKYASLPILNQVSTTRDCFAAAAGAVCFGISQDMKILVEKRTDLYDTHQIIVSGTYGAVRTDGKLVQKVQTTVDARR